MNEIIKNTFGGKLRIRVSGICIHDSKLLLIKHHGLGSDGELWSPPGGEVHFKESLKVALKREFLEEVNLVIDVREFLCLNEFKSGELHALELFFRVKMIGGELRLGIDPELESNDQILDEVKFVTFEELNQLPLSKKHNLFHKEVSEEMIVNMNGHFKLWQ